MATVIGGGHPGSMGLAESSDGLHWRALPPVVQPAPFPGGSPEIGSMSRLGRKVPGKDRSIFILAEQAQLFRQTAGANVSGEWAQVSANKCLLNMLNQETVNRTDNLVDCGDSNSTRSKVEQFESGRSCWNYPRAWDVHGDGSLVLMSVTRIAASEAWFDVLQQVIVDEHDTPRARWWPNNERLKGRALSANSSASLTSYSRKGWDMTNGLVVEATVQAGQAAQSLPASGLHSSKIASDDRADRQEFGLLIDFNGSAGEHDPTACRSIPSLSDQIVDRKVSIP